MTVDVLVGSQNLPADHSFRTGPAWQEPCLHLLSLLNKQDGIVVAGRSAEQYRDHPGHH
jgi:hypothetical protein